jgi:hypothetical protein
MTNLKNERAVSPFYLLGLSAFSWILDNFYHRIPSRIWVMKSILQWASWNISKLRMRGYYGASIHGNWQTLKHQKKKKRLNHEMIIIRELRPSLISFIQVRGSCTYRMVQYWEIRSVWYTIATSFFFKKFIF